MHSLNAQVNMTLNFKKKSGTSLVVQWLRICLAIPGAQVRFLVGELKSRMPWSNWSWRYSY